MRKVVAVMQVALWPAVGRAIGTEFDRQLESHPYSTSAHQRVANDSSKTALLAFLLALLLHFQGAANRGIIRGLSQIGEHSNLHRVRRVRIIVALVLLAFWPVITSHPLLQHFGLIHQVHEDHDGSGGSHEHDTDNHAFAEGDYLLGSKDVSIWKPLASATVLPFATAMLLSMESLARGEGFNSGPAPPGTAPPELSNCWQFSFRAALPVRAPSLTS
jgi:hypothetical protein